MGNELPPPQGPTQPPPNYPPGPWYNGQQQPQQPFFPTQQIQSKFFMAEAKQLISFSA